MLIAAGVGLARYLRQDAPARAAEAPPRPALALLAEPAPVAAQLAPTAPPPEALRPPSLAERMNEMLTSMPKNADAASDYLFERATRAEREGDTAFAEALLGHAFELDEKNPHPAFAMARIRFAQGNLSGAEGWVARAVQLRPRRAEYRRLYAKILDALGRPRQAQHEERRASELSR
jgi:Flp pilus assembly protein TadD